MLPLMTWIGSYQWIGPHQTAPVGVGIKHGSDSTTERHTSKIQKSVAPPLLALEGPSQVPPGISSGKSQNKNQKPSRSSSRDSEEPSYYEIVHTDIRKIPHFLPLPENKFTASLFEEVEPCGYPMSITLEGGMCLLHTFEKEFDGDMWSTLTKKLLIMCPNVSSPLLHSMGGKGILLAQVYS